MPAYNTLGYGTCRWCGGRYQVIAGWEEKGVHLRIIRKHNRRVGLKIERRYELCPGSRQICKEDYSLIY